MDHLKHIGTAMRSIADSPRVPHPGSTTNAGITTTGFNHGLTSPRKKPAGDPNSLPESLQQVIHVAGRNVHQAAGLIRDNLAAVLILREERARLRSALSPATANDIKAILGRLSLHYSLGNADKDEIRMLIDDYISDLSRLPAIAIDRACQSYRQNPKSTYFPKIGVLLELSYKTCLNERNALDALNDLLGLIDTGEPNLGFEPEKPTGEQWQQLIAELNSISDPRPDVPIMPVTDQNYFEKRAATKNSHTEGEVNVGA